MLSYFHKAKMQLFCVFVLVTAFKVVQGRLLSTDIPDFRDLKIQEMLSWKVPPELEEQYPYYLSGFDEEDCPIWISEMGKWDTRKSVESGLERERDFKRHVLQMLARIQESVKTKSTAEYPVTEFCIVIDMEGYNSRQTSSNDAVEMTLWMARQYEQAFKEHIKQGYILNGNYVFTNIWKLIKPILGQNVYKVEVFGNNKSRFAPVLLKTFPKDQLPEWYGGSKEHKPIRVYGKK